MKPVGECEIKQSNMSAIFNKIRFVVALFCLIVIVRMLLSDSAPGRDQDLRWDERQAAEHSSRQRLMKERVDLVQQACRRHNDQMQQAYRMYFGREFNNKQALHLNHDFLVARQQNIGWCKVPKVASTSMVQSLLRVLGREDLLSLGRSQQHNALRRLMPPPRLGETLSENLTAFMMVRHPFSRILSAYRDKILNKNDEESKNMFRKFRKKYDIPIIKKYRKSPPLDDYYKDVPTFPEFVDYLLDTSPSEYNEHWIPYFLLCLPCHVNYTVVLNLETIEDDYTILVEKTGFPQLKPSLTHSTKENDPLIKQTPVGDGPINYTVKYYSQIPEWKLKKLYEKYIIDFEMFGYDASSYFQFVSS